VCTYGKFFEETQQVFESLVGSLKAARKRGIMTFKGEMLLFPTHKDVELIMLKPYDPKDYPKYAKHES